MEITEIYYGSTCTFTVGMSELGVYYLSQTLGKIKLRGTEPTAGFIGRAIEVYLSQLARSMKPDDQVFRAKYPVEEIRQNLQDWLKYDCAPNDIVWH